jgi:hypothetical protein
MSPISDKYFWFINGEFENSKFFEKKVLRTPIELFFPKKRSDLIELENSNFIILR